MSSNPVINVNNLSKTYLVSHQLRRNAHPTLKDDVGRLLRLPLAALGAHHGMSREKFHALKDVSFSVDSGEVVGIMGRNGSGKSTLFKLLSRVTYPSSGEATIHGSVGSLLEVGTGFHPELTGRENIYFNGSILGMKKAEVAKKFDDIVAFSEVEKFLDTPVKFYSSGMKVRLAFSVAAHIDPEILLIDEVLAVGDVQFKQKSLAKMKQVAAAGTTILFVSHQIGQIEQICTRGIVLDAGQKKFDGNLDKAINTYLELNSATSEQAHSEEEQYVKSGSFNISDVKLVTSGTKNYPELSASFNLNNPAKQAEDLVIGAVIFDELNRNIAYMPSRPLKMTAKTNKQTVHLKIKRMNLVPDRYNLRLIVSSAADATKTYQRIEKAASFKLPEYAIEGQQLDLKHGTLPPVIFDYDYEL